jgi:hypothetical protein
VHIKIDPASRVRRLAAVLASALFVTGLIAVQAGDVFAVNGGACSRPYSVTITPADFTNDAGQPNPIDNHYFPLVPGTTFTYEGVKDDAPLEDVMTVTDQTRIIMGVPVRVVRDTNSSDGILVEDTFDWYAQDDAGNIWYFGEDTREFDQNGNVTSTEGSWEAGQGDNLPGLFMPSAPRSGATHRQEFAPDVAVDMATVLSLHQHITVPLAAFRNALETKEYSCLEIGIDHKFYAPGVGLVAELAVANGREYIKLASVT